jgi:hypothetical protein
VGIEELDLAGEAPGMADIVGVLAGQVLGIAGRLRRGGQGPGDPGAGIEADHREGGVNPVAGGVLARGRSAPPRELRAEQARRFVGRAVVHDHDVEAPVFLGKEAVEGRVQGGGTVAHR